MTITPADIHARRKLAVRLWEWACIGGARDTSNPHYLAVTEGRRGQHYSSCGDLAHWTLYRLGVRLPWINREEHRGWKPGLNVNRLCPLPIGNNSCSTVWTPEADVQGGDFVIIWNRPDATDAHVVGLIDVNTPSWDALPEGTPPGSLEYWYTAEFGQPGGKLCTREVHVNSIGFRKLHVWLNLERVLLEADAHELLEDPDLPEEMRA